MREPQQYEFLSGTILPELSERFRRGELRVWSAGCSSGEEPFTIAITLKKYFKANSRAFGASILATDISDNVLKHAAAANTGNTRKEWTRIRGDVFKKPTERTSAIIETIIRFEKFNLMHPVTSFYQKFHIISAAT
jgi:chemotaxis protein methyltransferase CheR